MHSIVAVQQTAELSTYFIRKLHCTEISSGKYSVKFGQVRAGAAVRADGQRIEGLMAPLALGEYGLFRVR